MVRLTTLTDVSRQGARLRALPIVTFVALGVLLASHHDGAAVAQGLGPGPPTLVATQVAANPVTLTWAPGPGGAPTGFVIVAGTAPGAANLGTFPMGLATTVTANAPVGTPVFVRVIAVNNAGSASSNEISFALGAAAGGIIPQQALYRVQINGEVVQQGGVTSRFSVPAFVMIVPTIDPAAFGVSNGPNPIDVGIFTDPSPIVGVAGALYFGTNTSLCGVIGCNTRFSALDTTFVTVNPAQGSVNIVVDGNLFGLTAARLNIFNIFNARTSLLAQIYHVLTGQVVLQFGNGAQTVAGSLALGGSSGFSGPYVTTVYQATLTGVRVQ